MISCMFSRLSRGASNPSGRPGRARQAARRRGVFVLEGLENRQVLSTFTWSAASSANWSDPLSWTKTDINNANTIPGASDNVLFDESSLADSVVDQNFTVKSITIAGSYTGAISLAANLTDLGGFSQDGGTFLVNTATLTSGKGFTVSGGTFDAGSGAGAVIFNAPTNYGPGPINAAGVAFNNVTINYGSHHLNVGGGLNVNGNLTINGVQQLTGVITAKGDITTTGAAMFSKSAADKIIIAGTGAKTLSAVGVGSLPNVEINRTGGALAISGNLNANGSWTHVKGAVNAAGSTVTFRSGSPIDSNTMAFGDVVIDSGTHVYVKKLKVGGNLNLKNVYSLNYTADSQGSGAITVAGDLSSSDPSVPTVVRAPVDVTMTGGGSAKIYTGADFSSPGPGAFPSGGVVIAKGSFDINANVTQPLDGPLTINSVYYFRGSLAVGGNVTSNSGNVYALSGGELVFQGGKNQTLTVAAGAHVPGVTIDKTGLGSLTFAASNLDGANPVNVTGNWDYKQGNIAVGNGKVVFLNGTTIVNTGPLGSGMAFNDVEVKIGSGTLNAQNMVVDGDLTLTSVYYINGVISAKGDVSTAANALASSSNNGRIEFVGGGDQTLTASSASGGVPAVVVNKPGGKLTLAGPTTIDVGGNWTWTKGVVDANDSTVRFTSPANTVNTGPGNGGMKFNNLVIDINSNTLGVTNKLGVLGGLTINSAWAINAAAGAITVGGGLISNDASVGGNADITMVVGEKLVQLEGGDFPNGGIVINRGSAHGVNAAVSQPLDGPLTLQNVGTLTGELQVGNNVTTNVSGITGNAGGSPVLVFTGNKAQQLIVTAPNRMVPGVKVDKSGGKLTLNDNLQVSGGWIVTAGNLADIKLDGTTVRFQLSGGYGDRTIDTGASAGFDNVEIQAGSAATVTIGAMVVNGDLLLSSASAINGGNIDVYGNVTTQSTTAMGGDSRVRFVGGNNQTLSATADDRRMIGVIVDKSGGALTIGSNRIAVTGNWDYIAGNVDGATNESTIKFVGGNKTIRPGSMVFHNVDFAVGSANKVQILDAAPSTDPGILRHTGAATNVSKVTKGSVQLVV